MDRDAAAELGRWIAAERAKRTLRGKPLSAASLARLANTYIAAQKLPVKPIHQQEISNLENAAKGDGGPKRRQPWWDVLREFIESRELDVLISAIESPPQDDDAVIVPIGVARRGQPETVVRTPDGEVVGKIIWDAKR